jgi:hypothetical protein
MTEILNFDGFIENVKYKALLVDEKIKTYSLEDFDINSSASYGLIQSGSSQIAYSKWVSPKRTRSYPFARIYNTYNSSKILTIIPIIKDEGKDGDLDKVQYSTFSWMNLLNIYVILSYYSEAEKNNRPNQAHKEKLTNQKFDNNDVRSQIEKIFDYRQSALHWNINLLKKHFTNTFNTALVSYQNISCQINVKIHNQSYLDKYLKKVLKDFNSFRDISLIGSQKASKREAKTIHKMEFLEDGKKGLFTIKNYLGGTYYLTPDEILEEDNVYIIQESKNSQRRSLPDLNDIQDGLFKLILYSNLSSLNLNGQTVNFVAKLKLTGNNILGKLILPCDDQEINFFITNNEKSFNLQEKQIIKLLNQEAQINQKLIIEVTSN